jgi:hypothetical protein
MFSYEARKSLPVFSYQSEWVVITGCCNLSLDIDNSASQMIFCNKFVYLLLKGIQRHEIVCHLRPLYVGPNNPPRISFTLVKQMFYVIWRYLFGRHD